VYSVIVNNRRMGEMESLVRAIRCANGRADVHNVVYVRRTDTITPCYSASK
jgi:hypothetical protein